MPDDKAPVAHAIGAFFVLAGFGGGAGHRARAPPRVADYFAARRFRVSSMPSAIDA